MHSTTQVRKRRTSFAAFDFDPDQLRVPKRNGKLSGRFLDGPGKILESLEDLVESKKAVSLNLQEATPELRARFKEMHGKAIPPAWKNVKIDLTPGSDLIASGVAANGKTQRLYTDRYTDSQAKAKWSRVTQTFSKLKELEAGLADVKGDGAKAAARLMLVEGIRAGSTDKQQGKVQAYGVATLRMDHASILPNGNVSLKFTAKEGIPADYEISDPQLVDFIKTRLAQNPAPDEKLFQTNSDKTKAVIRELTGLAGVKNHDLRTILANRIASAEVTKSLKNPPKTQKEYLAERKRIAGIVSEQLRNKPAQALNSYIDPLVFGPLADAVKGGA